MQLISSSLTFPPVKWWAFALGADNVIIDQTEHFQKMSYRNRYNISGANNPIQLSVPLVNGRDQRSAMADVLIHNADKWQVQHWRTLTSVYSRSPFWQYYEHSLGALFVQPFSHLTAFNEAGLQWVQKQLRIDIATSAAGFFVKQYPGDFTDIRNMKPATDKFAPGSFPEYYQVFCERTGFLPNLSILDLLFSEGPNTVAWIKANKARIL